ncbi:porin OmpA [Pasteurella bettyae]|uniref:porin OmpA n=1 Tax=Pasteurella bettyae TaxID=752 RepID=UPI003D27DD91
MKKTAIALAIASLAATTVAQAAPQENTFYAGAKAGWASYHDGIKYTADEEGLGFNRNSVTYGVFGGYQILNRDNLGLAVELGYDDFGRVKYKEEGNTVAKQTAHGAHLSLKGSYEVLPGLDAYARVGAALVRTDVKTYNLNSERAHDLKVSPVFAAGLEYAILPELAARIEYQWVNRVGKFEDADGDRIDYQPSIGAVTAGLSYRFGQGAAPVVAPEVVNKIFTLNSDVTFAFGKATLKPEASTSLDNIYGEISKVNNPSVAVAGYADRIGKDAANLKLSQRRAETVANYLVSKGVAQNAISATGYGEANPVTGNTCDAVKGKKALIACLAPDRRVEVSVQGNK